MPVITAVVVKSCVHCDAIPLKVLNCRIANFCFAHLTSVTNLGPFSLDFVSKDKALSIEKWCVFQLLPLLIGSYWRCGG